MLVVPALNVGVADAGLHAGGIHFDVADAELFRRHKVVFVLLIVLRDLVGRRALLRRQRVDVNRRLTDIALLRHQIHQLAGFAFKHKVGIGDGVDQLLGRQLLTQRFRVAIGGKAHAAQQSVIFRVVELAVGLERLLGENRLLDLIVANRNVEVVDVLIEQRLVHQLRQRLLTHLLHEAVVAGKLRELIAQHLLLAAALAVERLIELRAADFLSVDFSGVIAAAADKVVANAGQHEGEDNQPQNNLEHDMIRRRA